MGVGPVYAIPMALKNSGITQEDVDLFEASCVLSCAVTHVYHMCRSTKLLHRSACTAYGPLDLTQKRFGYLRLSLIFVANSVRKVNVNGGAIAFGHPLDEFHSFVITRSVLLMMIW
jgi:acetyl-CoA acyltransferase 1